MRQEREGRGNGVQQCCVQANPAFLEHSASAIICFFAAPRAERSLQSPRASGSAPSLAENYCSLQLLQHICWPPDCLHNCSHSPMFLVRAQCCSATSQALHLDRPHRTRKPHLCLSTWHCLNQLCRPSNKLLRHSGSDQPIVSRHPGGGQESLFFCLHNTCSPGPVSQTSKMADHFIYGLLQVCLLGQLGSSGRSSLWLPIPAPRRPSRPGPMFPEPRGLWAVVSACGTLTS